MINFNGRESKEKEELCGRAQTVLPVGYLRRRSAGHIFILSICVNNSFFSSSIRVQKVVARRKGERDEKMEGISSYSSTGASRISLASFDNRRSLP